MAARPQPRTTISGAQFVGIIVLTIILLLIVDYGRRVSTGFYIAQAEEQLKAEIAVELTRNAQLKARLEYVQSDEFVEKWAREEGHMARPGDRPFILVTVEAPRSAPQNSTAIVQTAGATPQPTWHQWWYLFFDTPPGRFR